MRDGVCPVSGSTPGIGKATALELARMGATLLMVAPDARRGEETLAEIQAAGG